MARWVVGLALIASGCRSAAPPVAGVGAPAAASAHVEPTARCVEPAALRAATAPFGSAHRGVPYRASRNAGWAIICEARQDTDDDGKIELFFGHHGELLGDDVVAYLSIGGGAGINIDDFVARDPSGRFVAVIQFEKLVLFDVATGTRTTLDGDIADIDPVAGPHRAAAFSPNGRFMLYHRSGAVIVRELATCRERSIDLGPGLVGHAGFNEESTAILVEHIERDTNGDGFLSAPRATTTLSERRCRGSAAVASFFGGSGDRPIYKRVALTGGAVTVVDSAKYWVAPDDARELVATTGGGKILSDAPLGPFRFKE